jgi:hypothetical protein
MDPENNLQINITAVDEASSTIEKVGASADEMATSIGEAADSIQSTMTSALTAAEEAAADAAVASAEAWIAASDEVAGSATAMAETVGSEFGAVSTASEAAALATIPTWEDSMAEIASIGNMTAAEVDAAFARMGDAGEAAATRSRSSMSSVFGYFRYLMAGYMLQQLGGGLTGAVESAVTAAAGDPTKLAQLQDQLQSQQAELARLEVPISGKGKTTDQLNAAQAVQYAQIDAAQEKIKELQAQIQPLVIAQQAAGTSAQAYDQAVKDLTLDWQRFLATIGAPLLDNLAKSAEQVDGIVKVITAWAEKNPELARQILTFAGTLGVLTTAIGGLTIAFAFMQLILSPELLLFIAISSAVAVVTALIVTFHTQLSGFLDDLNSKTGIITFFENQWHIVATTFDTQLMPALTRLWVALQPLMPYLADLAKVGLAVLVIALRSLVTEITAVVVVFTEMLTIITNIATFLTNTFVAAINDAKRAFQGFSMPSILTGGAGALSNGFSSLLNIVPHFADGGIVSGPTFGLIGEAGPEAIIPLSAFAGGPALAGVGSSTGGGNIIVQLSGNFYGSDQSMMQKLSTQLGKMIGQQLKLRTH